MLSARAVRTREEPRTLGRCFDGRDALQMGRADDARRAFLAWLDLAHGMTTRAADRVEAHASLGAVCAALERPVVAESELRAAVRLAQQSGETTLPTDAADAARVCLAMTWTRLGFPHAAAAGLAKLEGRHASPLAPGTIDHVRGEVALDLGQLDDALHHAHTALSLRAVHRGEHSLSYATSLVLLGRALHARGELVEAESTLASAVKIVPPNAEKVRAAMIAAVASLLWDTGRHAPALQAVSIAHHAQAKSPLREFAPSLRVLETLGSVLRAAGRASELEQINTELQSLRGAYAP